MQQPLTLWDDVPVHARECVRVSVLSVGVCVYMRGRQTETEMEFYIVGVGGWMTSVEAINRFGA